ncbi:MAG: hypothetical protein H6718_28995 [Polyangiaceae bacterium]|nr:hypothetical protein [Myxococcales bacterium]MCB9589486.1 hypothetical protein [Polyangiaceae bacterium]MCB9609947.1 hypothetical protein [Polyangiaceae bacterium]
MIRVVIASFLMGGPLLALAPSAGPNPPDSLDPNGPRSEITFTHKARRVLSCEAKRSPKLTCKAKKDQVDPTTSVRLVPVRTPDITGEDQRRSRSVTLSPDGAQARQAITLAAGVWELEWAGRKKHERFRVADDQPFTIKLSTTSGSCEARDNECRLDATKVSQTVSVPAGRMAQ